jgi:hypothetical protein
MRVKGDCYCKKKNALPPEKHGFLHKWGAKTGRPGGYPKGGADARTNSSATAMLDDSREN